jgi:hypothetical protein
LEGGGISMPFYPVRDKYVFLHHKNNKKLNDIALMEKDALWKFSSNIAGRIESKEANKLRQKTLNDLYKMNTYEDFFNEWIFFELEKQEEIKEELTHLFYDYSFINNAFSFKKIKHDIVETIFPELYYDKDYCYEISIFNKSIFKKPEKVFSTIIDPKEILSIKGELKNFTIDLRHKTLVFGKTITLNDK